MLSIHIFEMNPLQENTYIVYNEAGACAIIDPGCYSESEKEKLSSFIVQHKLRPVYLLNTHCHLDHVFGNKFVSDYWGLPLHLHAEEKYVLSFAPTSAEMYGLPFENYKGEMILLKEGDIITMGKDELKVLFTPGHSPGSVSFYAAKEHFVISGDVLFKNSIGRTDLPGGHFDTLQASIKNTLYKLPDDTKVYCGHGPVTYIGIEKRNNPFVRQE